VAARARRPRLAQRTPRLLRTATAAGRQQPLVIRDVPGQVDLARRSKIRRLVESLAMVPAFQSTTANTHYCLDPSLRSPFEIA
jgi:hypothetical protein